MADLKITEAFISVFKLISSANKYIDNTEPWNLKKNEKTEELASVMNHLANALYIAGTLLQPVLPHASAGLFEQLGVEDKIRDYQLVHKFGVLGGQTVNKGQPLFPRLDVEEEVAYIKSLMNGN